MRFWVMFLVLSSTLLGAGYENDYYAVTTLRNDTSHTIYYSYKWTETGLVYKNSIKPGRHYVHYWVFDYPNENFAPPLYVKMEDDGIEQWWALKSFFAPDISAHRGRLFRFKTIVEDMSFVP